MNRTRLLWMLTVVAGASCVWWTGVRAADEAASAPPLRPVAELLARIDKLEQRVQTLEGQRQAARQIDALLVPAGGWLTTPSAEPKPGLPHRALIVPPKPERAAGGAFFPRHIEVTPE